MCALYVLNIWNSPGGGCLDNKLTFRQFLDIAKSEGVEITFIDKNFFCLHRDSRHPSKYIKVYDIDAFMSDEAQKDLFGFLDRIHDQ